MIQSVTDIGEVTARILDFNNEERVLERELLIKVDRYPLDVAKKRISKL